MPRDIEKTLRGCFHSKEGEPNLQKVPVNADRAKQHIDKSHQNILATLKKRNILSKSMPTH